ncbi:TadE/TadG family type IV pilus assembly protein [Gottfriedia sp. NPDC058432]|uniref:TadE/TadG family type IV pilus assembly protein n=1 Tax=Gottfriedia sp. NPDC058432 TaxID=3346497 RepID=UPI003662CDFF
MKNLPKLILKIKNENGATFVFVALLMVFLLGITAIVIDVGRLYSEKSKLQNALDAGVLGGAQLLLTEKPSPNLTPESVAMEIAKNNGLTLIDPIDSEDTNITTDLNDKSIRATKKSKVPMTFARVIGIKEMEVNATAKAILRPLKSGKGITPIAVSSDVVKRDPNPRKLANLTCTIKKNGNGNNKGNCGYLSLNGTGAKSLADAIINGSEMSIGGSNQGEQEDDAVAVSTEPGTMLGQVKLAIDVLKKNDANKPQCQNYETADNSCDRVIILPVVQSWDNINGRATVTIIGLAAYWIDGINGKSISGQFIKMVGVGEIDRSASNPVGQFSQYNIQGVRLAE